MSSTKKPRTKQELILEAWDRSGSESVGAYELGLIQQALAENLGHGAIESPASLARILADLGVPLRHPEVLDFDAAWRERRLKELFELGDLDFKTPEGAMESAEKLENLRSEFAARNDEAALRSLVEHIREIKGDLAGLNTDLSKEVIQWLTIWLQNPQIFRDWLSLRCKSAEFLRKFGS